MTLTKDFIGRSKGLPLSVFIVINALDVTPFTLNLYTPFLEMIWATSHRWTCATFSTPAIFINRMDSVRGKLPLLRYLRFIRREEQPDDIDMGSAFGDAPRLMHLNLREVKSHQIQLPWSHIRKLFIDDPEVH